MSAQQGFDFGPWSQFYAGRTQTQYDPEAEARKREDREREKRERAQREYERRQREDKQRRERYRTSYQAFDPYAVLDLVASATAKDIRAAWVRLVKTHHPDVGGNAAMFRDVQRAYELLKGRL